MSSSSTENDNSNMETSEIDPTTVQDETMECDGSEPVTILLRDSHTRPVYKLSIKLIDTYKHINKIYYEEKARRLRTQKDTTRGGVHNEGYDDQNYDYILQGDEILHDRYILKHRMGKGSFGQVVCAYDQIEKREVAIKIIKSRRPFLVQARTEIEILNKILEKDPDDERHVVRLNDQFIHRNHQCIVFEILSFNLYELLRHTKFRGVSLNLIRKFSIQLLRALELLSHPEVNIIHCDLKPENILLRHPKRSAIKLIDFGSSCYANKRTYTYIQSRFYRSPEVLFGIPYTQKIDMWSLGCVAVEMHTGEPLFGGANQVDQICRIIDVLGMPPLEMIRACTEKTRCQFFEKVTVGDEQSLSAVCDVSCSVIDPIDQVRYVLKRPNKDLPKPRTLEDVIGVSSGGPSGRRLGEPGHSQTNYEEFLDFIRRMLVYLPEQRASPSDMASHPYLRSVEDYVRTTTTMETSDGGPLTPQQNNSNNNTIDSTNISNNTSMNNLTNVVTSSTTAAAPNYNQLTLQSQSQALLQTSTTTTTTEPDKGQVRSHSAPNASTSTNL